MEVIDFEKLEKKSNKKSSKNIPSDMSGIVADILLGLPWSLALVMFIMYILLNSDIFINNVLARVEGASKNMVPTNKGTFISGFIMSIALIIAYMLLIK